MGTKTYKDFKGSMAYELISMLTDDTRYPGFCQIRETALNYI